MKILITGAHGFIGSHLVRAQLQRGHAVTALVSPWGRLERLADLLDNPQFNLARADITVPEGLCQLCAGHDVIVHAAARAVEWGPWSSFYQTNVVGTRNLLDAAAAGRVRRFVLISSVTVHRFTGHRDADPRTTPRTNHEFPYARSKILAEDLVLEHPHLEGVVVRPGLWPFGPGDPNFVRVASVLRRGVFPTVGSGRSVINTAYVENLAAGVAAAGERPGIGAKVYVIADDGAPSWNELLGELARLLGVKPWWLRLPPPIATAVATATEQLWGRLAPSRRPPLSRYAATLTVNDVHFSTAAAREELGYQPTIDWREGLARTANWYRQRSPPV